MKQPLYSIGEVAKLTNVSIQTLRYYDQIDLFKPSFVDPATNYRYYTDMQLFYLDLIKSLKYIGTPLEEIKKAQALTPDEMLLFLEKRELALEEKLTRLTEVQNSLLKTKKQMQEQIAIPAFDIVYEKQEEEVRILTIASPNITPDYVPNAHYSSLKQIIEGQGSVMNSRYGCTYPLQHYNDMSEIHYSTIFTPLLTDRFLTNLTNEMDVTKMVAGTYICIAFLFTVENYFQHYEKLYAYILEKKLSVHPEVYEIFMPTNYAPNHVNGYIVELKVRLLAKK